MAEVGKIYWKKANGTVHLRGTNASNYNLLDQNTDPNTVPWFSLGYTVFSAVIEDEIKPLSCAGWFASNQIYDAITSITGLANIDTSNVTSFKSMFGCPSSQMTTINIQDLDLSTFDTSSATDMACMFYGCREIETINLSGFDTSKVTDMTEMFAGCSKLTELDLSGFDFSHVTKITGTNEYVGMLENCWSLETVELPEHFGKEVASMRNLFKGCSSLTSLDLTKFDTGNVTDMSSMFYGCTGLLSLDLSGFDISNLVGTTSMFSGCSSLTTIYAHPNADWNASEALTSSSGMFTGCTSLVGGNSTAHGSSTAAADNNKTKARIDRSGQPGYFTVARRTLSKSITGNGTLTGDGEYDYGTIVTVVAAPDSGYYTDSVTKTIGSDTETLSDTDTVAAQSFSFEIKKDMSVAAAFGFRAEHTLSAASTGGFKVNGELSYSASFKYLDVPTVIVDLGGGLIPFDGWYSNDQKISSQNPYTFVMPDADLSLTAKTGDTPFDDSEYRQFILQNSFGEIYVLNSKESMIYMNDPEGLGFSKTVDTTRIGHSETVDKEEYKMPSVKGVLMFRGNTVEEKYRDYNEFARFIARKPITLWYKIPVHGAENIYHIPVEVMSVEKTEVSADRTLRCSIEMYGTGFWSMSDITVARTVENIGVFNDSDFDMGIDLTVYKADGTTFTNPVITFSQNDVVYGVCALYSFNSQAFSRIRINTQDSRQSITLYDENSDIIDNPFGFIDFEYADGVKSFPFPKLKQGLTTIGLSYDGASTENRIYLLTYDKEYLSV